MDLPPTTRALLGRRLCRAGQGPDCRQDAQLPACDGAVPGAAAAVNRSRAPEAAAAAAGGGGDGEGSSSTGAIVGGVVGGLAAAAAALAGLLLLLRRRRRRRQRQRELPFYADEARISEVSGRADSAGAAASEQPGAAGC